MTDTSREAIIAKLRYAHTRRFVSGLSIFSNAADMLEADAQEIEGWKADQKENLANQVALQEQINALEPQKVEVPTVDKEMLLAAWLQWCLDNCDDSPEYNFGTTATEHMHALLAGMPAPMPPTKGVKS